MRLCSKNDSLRPGTEPTARGPQAGDPDSLGSSWSEHRLGHVSAPSWTWVTQRSQPRSARAQSSRLETPDQEANATSISSFPDPPPRTCGHCFQGFVYHGLNQEEGASLPPSPHPSALLHVRGPQPRAPFPSHSLLVPQLPSVHLSIHPSIPLFRTALPDTAPRGQGGLENLTQLLSL